MIRLRTLGSIGLHSATGEQLDAVVAQPKRLALLVFLTLARPFGFHRRDRLLAMFWPERDETHARNSLNQAVRFLRQALGSSLIVSRGAEDIGVDRAQVWCDAVEFQTAIAENRAADAIELYHGELASGFFVTDSRGFDEWLESERARLREQASQAARALAEREEASGNLTQAVRWGRMAVTLSDGDERTLRRWLTMLAGAGDRAGAIQAYEEFARRLQDEYEADPSPETRALVESIRKEVRRPAGEPRPVTGAAVGRQATPLLESTPLASIGVFTRGWYSITREIGAGGMATVYLAHDVRHSRWVAVKVLRPEIALTVGADGFLREIRIAAGLQHPHIVPVFDSGAIDGRLYFVMPLVGGESLRARLERDGPLPLGDAVRIAREIADALAYAHKQGIVHLDIKPENVLLTGEPGGADSHAMVADFGIARAIASSGAEARLSETGVVVGSAAYMSPEQAAGDELDGRSDVYSLGCVLYEMLTGKPPFVGATRLAVLVKHSTASVPNLDEVREGVPVNIVHAIRRALSKVAEERYQDVAAFAREIQWSPHTASLGSTDAPVVRPHPAAPVGHRRRRFATMVGGTLLVAGLAGGGWFAWQSDNVSIAGTRRAHEYPKQDVAVLYFEDRSRDHTLQYLADGLTDALIRQMRMVSGLTVVSEYAVASSRQHAVRRTDSIADMLQVGTVIRGSVAPLGSGFRVTIEVIDAASGRRVASTRFDQTPPNTIWLQDSLARAATRLLRARLGDLLPGLVSVAGTRSPAAWKVRQTAKAFVWDGERLVTLGDTAAALRRLEAADSVLELVEANDEFWMEPVVERARLSFRHARLFRPSDPRFGQQIDVGLAHVGRVLRVDPNDTQALEMRGSLNYLRWLSRVSPTEDDDERLLRSAERDLTAATIGAAAPATAWYTLSHLRLNTGNLSGAAVAAENALRLDRFLPTAYLTVQRLFLVSVDLGLYDEAKKWCEIGRARFLKSGRFSECKLWLYALPGADKPDPRDIWQAYDEYRNASPASVRQFIESKGKLIAALALIQAGQSDSARALANSTRRDSLIDPRGELRELAIIAYWKAGDRDSALELATRAAAADPQWASRQLKDHSWWLKDLRSDPRFQSLIHRRRS